MDTLNEASEQQRQRQEALLLSNETNVDRINQQVSSKNEEEEEEEEGDETKEGRSSPNLVPSIEVCIEKIQSKIKAVGLEKTSVTNNFHSCIQLLRVFHNYYTGIPLLNDNGLSINGYLYPCKNQKYTSSTISSASSSSTTTTTTITTTTTTCSTYRISTKFFRQGMYCSNCQCCRDQETRRLQRINRVGLSNSSYRRVNHLPKEHLIQMVNDLRKMNRSLKRKQQSVSTSTVTTFTSTSSSSSSSSTNTTTT